MVVIPGRHPVTVLVEAHDVEVQFAARTVFEHERCGGLHGRARAPDQGEWFGGGCPPVVLPDQLEREPTTAQEVGEGRQVLEGNESVEVLVQAGLPPE